MIGTYLGNETAQNALRKLSSSQPSLHFVQQGTLSLSYLTIDSHCNECAAANGYACSEVFLSSTRRLEQSQHPFTFLRNQYHLILKNIMSQCTSHLPDLANSLNNYIYKYFQDTWCHHASASRYRNNTPLSRRKIEDIC